jgi:predicted Fe-Mo cluster-binding NifX family protein
MKAAFSTWDNRIAPVFDVSDQIRLVGVESGKIVQSELVPLPRNLPVQQALRLAELKAEVLICGAISRAMHEIIDSYGIQVIPFIAGALDEVVQAWVSGLSDWTCFSMPGCTGGVRRRNSGRNTMCRRGHMTAGAVGGQRKGGVGDCVCHRCGHKQPHERGIPCTEIRCPSCGASMFRG